MIYDYVVVAWALDIVRTMLNNWPICAIGTAILWLLFTIRIGNQRELCMQDLMPGDERL